MTIDIKIKIRNQLTAVLNAEESYRAAYMILEQTLTKNSGGIVNEYLQERIAILKASEAACEQQVDALQTALEQE